MVVQGHGLQGDPGHAVPVRVARAKKLLAEAGVGNGFSLDVYAYQLPGLPEGKTFAEAIAGYWEKLGIKPQLIPVDYPAFRKAWVDRGAPGAVGYFNIANRDWIGAYALLEKMAYGPSKPNDTVNDPEIDAMIAQVMRQTDREKINTLMRNIYTRLRSEHSACRWSTCIRPYATSKTLGKWNVGHASCTTSSSTQLAAGQIAGAGDGGGGSDDSSRRRQRMLRFVLPGSCSR